MPARMNTGSSRHVGASSESLLSQQSGTEGYQATRGRTVRHTPKQNHAQTRTTKSTVKSMSIRRRDDDDDDHHHHSQIENNNHTEASSSSRIRLAGNKNDSQTHSELTSKNLQAGAKTRSVPNIGPYPRPSLSRDALQLTTKNGDMKKKTSRRSMDKVAGFDGGPSTVPARPTRRRVQRETGAVPVPVPGKGTRPSPVQSTSIEVGKRKENGQTNQLSRSSSLAVPTLYWDPEPKKKPVRRNVVKNTGMTNIIDVDKDALDAERQKRVATLKKITFSKKKVKEEVREEEDALRLDKGDADVDSERGRRERGGSREATAGVGGEMLEQVLPQREHSPWTLDERGNIPGLSATSRPVRIHGPYSLPQARAVPIPPPSLFPDPPDEDISDEDLYSPKEDAVAPQVQVKEEQREDEDVFFDSSFLDPFPDLQTPISAPPTIGLEQNATTFMPTHADNSALYPLDTECTTHPKNKRKQHGLSHAKNAPSPKKVKTDVYVLDVQEGQSESHREVVRVQGEESHASMPAPKKGARRSKKKEKGKEKEKDVVIDQVETHVGREVLLGGEDEMEICAVETEQGEIPAGDALSLAAASGAVSTAGPSDSQTRVEETIGRKESEGTGENAEQDKRVNAGTEISVTPSTDPLLASASVHDAARVEPSASDSVLGKSSRKGKRKGRATETGAGSTDKVSRRKRNVRGQVGEQTQNHDANPVGDEEISHPEGTPRKKRKVNDQVTEGVDCQAGASPAGDGEEPRPDETPRKRTKVDDQTTEGERTEGGPAGDEHIPQEEGDPGRIPQQEETPRNHTIGDGERTEEYPAEDGHISQQETPTKMDDPTTDGGERTEGKHLPQQEETPTKMNDQSIKGGERTERDPAVDEHIPQQEETPKRRREEKNKAVEGGERTQKPVVDDHLLPQQEETPKKGRKEEDQTTEGGQGHSAGSAAADDIARPDKTPTKKRKAKDQSATEGAPRAEKRRGRPPKEKKNDEDTNAETSLLKVTEENGAVNEVKKTPRGRKKRATMDEKDGTTDSAVRKKKRVNLALEEGSLQSGKTVQSTVKWTLVCKNRTGTGRKASRQGKGKEKATALEVDVDENEENEGNVKTRKTLRPSIWASSKTELLHVLPELSGSKCFNGITEGSSNFPMVMLDESTAESIGIDVRWPSSGETPSVRLTLARDFVCPVPECASMLMGSVASSDPGPSSGVMTHSNVSPSVSPGVFSVPSVYGNSCGPLPVVLPSDDKDGMDLEYIDEDAPQGGAFVSLSVPSVKMSPISLTPIVPYAPPVAREATTAAHLSHKMQSFLQAPTCYPIIQFGQHNPTNLSMPSTISIPSREATTIAHISHNMQSFSQVPGHPIIQFGQHYPSTPPMIPIPSRESMTTAHISHNMQSFSQAPALPMCHPAIQFSPYNPLSTPSTISIPSLQMRHLPFHPDQIPFPQYGNNAPVPIPIPSQIPYDDEKPSPSTPSELDTITPPSPPPEIEILTSSSKPSLPLILICSHETFKRHFWGPLTPPHSGDSPEQAEKVGLAVEHAYVFLGFFRVVKKDERRVALSDEERVNLTPGKAAGRVEWTFDVEWDPGYHRSKGSEELSRPWWAPNFVFGRPVGRERGSKKGFTWIEKHAQARLNLLPMQLVDGQEAGSSDEAMPKGWLCKACGKLNQKVMMRHRWCGSRMCRDNPLSRGYAVDLSSARDANQTPLALPINTCNRMTVDASVADWDDGMRTLKYRPMAIPDWLGNPGQRSGILQHVFTCNLVGLQTEATPLFESIQRDVCLMKSTGDSSPFFRSHVSDSDATKRDKYAFSCLSWSEAPQALRDAQDLMTFVGKKYGEEETLDIDKLTIVGWVSSGTRKTPTTLAAREHAIAMLCLGNDVVLTIVPKWEVSAPVLESLQSPNLAYPSHVPFAEMADPAALPRVANFTPPKIQSALARTPRPIKPPSANQMQLVDASAAPATENYVGAIIENPPNGVIPAQITSRNSRSKPASKLKPKSKQAPESMSVTLVHGDMLLFSGCDFEYSIKRMGTSILVIGSKEDSTASI